VDATSPPALTSAGPAAPSNRAAYSRIALADAPKSSRTCAQLDPGPSMRTEPPQDEPTTTAVPFCGTRSNERSYPAETTASGPWDRNARQSLRASSAARRPPAARPASRARLVERELRLRAEAERIASSGGILLRGGQCLSASSESTRARYRCPLLGTAGSPRRP
jgi:hypothetical protein